jgi:glycosyltransferase 2 family protein
MGNYRRLIVIGIALALLAFIAVTLLSDVSQLTKFALVFPWLVMIPVLALRVGNWLTRYIKWVYYLRRVGVKSLTPFDTAITFGSGLAMAASPGKVAELLKCFIIRGITGVPVAVTIPTILAERLTDGIAVLMLMMIAISQLATPEYLTLVLITLALLILAIGLLSVRPLCLALLRLVEKLPIIGRFAGHFTTFYESSYTLMRPVPILVAIGIGLVGNGTDGVGMFILLTALGQPPTAHTFFLGLLAVSSSVVTGAISGSPGGVGAADLTITGVLQKVGGLSVPEAGFATLLARIVQLWWGVLVGLVISAIYRRRLFSPNTNAAIAESRADEQLNSTPAML